MMPTPPYAPPDVALRVAGTLGEVRRLTDCLRTFAAAHQTSEETLIDLELAVAEAANNVVIHGYKNREGEITLHLTQQDRSIRAELVDTGTPIPASVFERRSSPAPDAESGRGMAIIGACVDEVRYTSVNGVNTLSLLKRSP